ncbi:hypothetical protein L1987_30486 [Smallanthus sonchifolius]|uniref:Uncharacterized protein n=1 Tax=Smallanthus sonchifolius TaxID=185202 RepID=A0ACB9I4Q0_9ASTR|nr:hypothetical protein L1987_30486 [Smallanthus sonchifolius]
MRQYFADSALRPSSPTLAKALEIQFQCQVCQYLAIGIKALSSEVNQEERINQLWVFSAGQRKRKRTADHDRTKPGGGVGKGEVVFSDASRSGTTGLINR